MFDLFFLTGQGLDFLLAFLQLSLHLVDLVTELLVLIGQVSEHLLVAARFKLLFEVVHFVFIVLSCILPEFVDDARYDAYQFSLNNVVHVEDERDVLSSVVTLDGDSQQKLP